MPELPEVETTRRGIAPHLIGRRVIELIVRRRRLRWPVPPALATHLAGATIHDVSRRAKYLLLETEPGAVLIHLGMSGSLRVLPRDAPPHRHDHIDLVLDSGRALRFNDPRRFGCWLWQPRGRTHPLLRGLGPEPLDTAFDGDWLWRRARGRTAPIKSFLMDQRIVVGVGNIYVAEALFRAGIAPRRAAGRVSRERYARVAGAIRAVLTEAIAHGGTTLRDFLKPDGEPGYFEQALAVYGRAGGACRVCGTPVRGAVLGQRASYWCPACQR